MNGLWTRAALLLAALVALMLAPSGAAANIHCGKTVLKNIKLKANLDCSAGGTNGLEVGANKVTIDLNGHEIVGAGGDDGYEGIENDGYSKVTIKNGTIRKFQDDVYLLNVTHNKLQKLKLSNDEGTFSGIRSAYGSGNVISHNKISNSDLGIHLENGSGNRITRNRFVDTTTGLDSTYEAGDRITGNTSHGLNVSTTAFRSQHDFATLYRKNTAESGYYGFDVSSPTDVVLDHVRALRNGYAGIYFDDNARTSGYSATVKNSTSNNNAEYGIYGASPVKGHGNVAVGNKYYNCYLVSCNG